MGKNFFLSHALRRGPINLGQSYNRGGWHEINQPFNQHSLVKLSFMA